MRCTAVPVSTGLTAEGAEDAEKAQSRNAQTRLCVCGPPGAARSAA